MKGVRLALAFQRLRGASAWKLLTPDHAPIALGLLHAHLGGQQRRLPGSILLERLRRDLDELRGRGIDLPSPAETYLSGWLRAGFLTRSFPPGATEEEYELSAAAVAAIRFIESQEEGRAIATETRLSLVLQQLRQLAEQTEADAERRLAALLRERDRLEAEIAAVRRGEIETLPEDRAIERAREAAALARELTADFRRVRDEFSRINRELRERIVEHEGSRGEVLAQVFAGVDLVAESDAGRTFRAFWRLLNDAEASADFEQALDAVLSRDFARRLPDDERRFLGRLTDVLLDNGGEVHEVLQQLARGLKQFVQSQIWQEQRRMNRLLREALQAAKAVRESVHPAREIGMTLNLTSADIRSVAQWRLRNPDEDSADFGIRHAAPLDLSLDALGALLADSDINIPALRARVRQLLEERAQVSVAKVLEAFPPEQGLGSVIGLIALASREGVTGKGFEETAWTGRDQVRRRARIPNMFFVSQRDDRSAA